MPSSSGSSCGGRAASAAAAPPPQRPRCGGAAAAYGFAGAAALGDALGDASRCIESRRTKKFSCSRPGESAAPPPLRAASGTTRVGETSSAHTWWRGGSPGGGARGEDGWLVPFAGAPRGAGRGSRGGIGGAAPAAFALLPPDESADVRVADVDVPPVGCLAGEATRSLSTRSRSSISSDELTFLTSALRSDIMKSRFKAYCCAEASSSLRTRLPPSTSQCPFLSGGSVKEERFSSAFFWSSAMSTVELAPSSIAQTRTEYAKPTQFFEGAQEPA